MCCVPRTARHVTDYGSALLQWLQLLLMCLCQVCGHEWYGFFSVCAKLQLIQSKHEMSISHFRISCSLLVATYHTKDMHVYKYLLILLYLIVFKIEGLGCSCCLWQFCSYITLKQCTELVLSCATEQEKEFWLMTYAAVSRLCSNPILVLILEYRPDSFQRGCGL